MHILNPCVFLRKSIMFCLTCALSSQFPEGPMDSGPEPVNDAGSAVNN